MAITAIDIKLPESELSVLVDAVVISCTNFCEEIY